MKILIDPVRTFYPKFPEKVLESLRTYCELVLEKNIQINLISRKDTDRIVEAHLLPSLAIYKIHPFKPETSVLDIGSGGGFPAIPLAIVQPEVHFTLIDSIGKKIRAVETFAQQLGLRNVTCLQERAEQLTATYHAITGRAVTDLESFRILAEPHLKPKGTILYLSGGSFSLQKKDTQIFDLYERYQHQYCETKKLLVIQPVSRKPFIRKTKKRVSPIGTPRYEKYGSRLNQKN